MQPRIHDKYLLRQFLRILLYSILAFVVIYVTVDVFEEIDNYIDHEARLRYVVLYYIYSIPFILTYIIPVSLLLATVFSMGILARRNELTALIASGVSLMRTAAPILVVSVLVSCFSAYFNDVVVSAANRKKDDVMHYDIEGQTRDDYRVRENFHYLGEGGYVFLADNYNVSTSTLYDVVVQEFRNNTLSRRVDAKRAEWRQEQWVFYGGFVRAFGGADSVQAFDEKPMPEIHETPDDFSEEEVAPEAMNFQELRRYIGRVRRSGGSVEKHLVDLYFKLSFPFAGCIFVLIGIAFASGKRKQSIATGFGVTLVVSFLYYGVLRIGQTLGHNGALPPFLAAQLGNIIFLGVGMVLLARANR